MFVYLARMPCADSLCTSDIRALSKKLGDSVQQLDAFRFLRRHKKKKEEVVFSFSFF